MFGTELLASAIRFGCEVQIMPRDCSYTDKDGILWYLPDSFTWSTYVGVAADVAQCTDCSRGDQEVENGCICPECIESWTWDYRVRIVWPDGKVEFDYDEELAQ